MTNEEMQRAMEFIIQRQAQYAARLEKDEPRLAGLEESFKMLVELVRRADERPDPMAKLRHTMNQLTESMSTLAEAQRRRGEEDLVDLTSLRCDNPTSGNSMKNKRELTPNPITPKKPPRQIISDAEFRRRLKERTLEWRKERLAELRSKNSG